MAEDNAEGNTLTIQGGNNQFVVTYKYADDSGSASITPQFGAAGSLNNVNPDFDFSTLDNGKVYTVMPGESSPTISGGNQQFVVQYILPAGSESAGGYGVQVNGGNNAFVVANNVPLASDAAGNTVSVDGGNNAFVVAYPTSGSATDASANGADPLAPTNGVSLSGRGVAGSGNGSGVMVGSPGNNSVSINGDNNQYVVDYGNAASGGFDASGLMPGGIGMSGSVMPTSGSAGAPSTADLAELLKMSPFGRILDIPGVTPDQLIAGFASATAGNGAGGGNPFAGTTPGTNPFSGLGGAPGDASSMPATPTTSGGSNPFASLGGATGTPDAMTATPAGGGSDSASPAATDPNYSYDFSSFGGASAGPASAPAIPAGAAPDGDQMASLLQQSPFGALLNIPGFTAADLTSAFAAGGENPFGGNPFDFDPTNGAAESNPLAAGAPADVAAMAQSFFGAMASGSTPAAAFAMFQNGADAGQTMLAGVGESSETSVPAVFLANT